MPNTDVVLGCKAKDRITGFAGVVTGLCQYISGCNQSLLTPGVDEKGALRDAQWFDIQRVDREPGDVIALDNGQTPGPGTPAPRR